MNAQPAYQRKAVASYLAANNPHYPKGTYNISGRAIPDVALLGANVTILEGGKTTISGGTSAATPMFAAMINRINDERLLAGKKPIGFLNQILYQHPEVFTDVSAFSQNNAHFTNVDRSPKALILVAARQGSRRPRDGIRSREWAHPSTRSLETC